MFFSSQLVVFFLVWLQVIAGTYVTWQYGGHFLGILIQSMDHRELLGDAIKEECGVVGVFTPGEEVASTAFFGLFALQHRGQESAGIAVSVCPPHRLAIPSRAAALLFDCSRPEFRFLFPADVEV